MIAYHGGAMPGSPEEGKAHMEKWKSWIQNLGPKVVNPGTPLKNAKILGKSDAVDDDSPDAMHGFAVIQAHNIEEAIEIAKEDPFLNLGGKVKVYEMIKMG